MKYHDHYQNPIAQAGKTTTTTKGKTKMREEWKLLNYVKRNLTEYHIEYDQDSNNLLVQDPSFHSWSLIVWDGGKEKFDVYVYNPSGDEFHREFSLYLDRYWTIAHSEAIIDYIRKSFKSFAQEKGITK